MSLLNMTLKERPEPLKKTDMTIGRSGFAPAGFHHNLSSPAKTVQENPLFDFVNILSLTFLN